MLQIARMAHKIVGLAMLYDKDAIGLEQIVLEDEVGDGIDVVKGIGRVGKDEVELLAATLDKPEHIAADEHVGIGAQLGHALADEVGMVAVGLDADHLRAASRQHLERYAARAGKEVERHGAVEVYISIEHIEDILLGKVCSGSRLERTWYIEVASLIYSCDNSHLPRI